MAKRIKPGETKNQPVKWSPETDCCNRNSPTENHAPGCQNEEKPDSKDVSAKAKRALAAKLLKEADEIDLKPVPKLDPSKLYVFQAKARCYVEGMYLEGEQTITLNSRAADRQIKNVYLELIETKEPREGEPAMGAEPKAGQAPERLRLINPAPQH